MRKAPRLVFLMNHTPNIHMEPKRCHSKVDDYLNTPFAGVLSVAFDGFCELSFFVVQRLPALRKLSDADPKTLRSVG